MGIPVYVSTMHLSGTEGPSPNCHRLAHKHYVNCMSYRSTVCITIAIWAIWNFRECFTLFHIGIVTHKVPQYTITNTIYFDWWFIILWLRSAFRKYFDDLLVSFKKQKKTISQQTRKGPYIYDVHLELG